MEEPIEQESPFESPGEAKHSGGSPETFAALRHRNFQLYFGGQLISNAGTWMQIIAQGWLVYQLTHSDLALGIVGFAAAVAVLAFIPAWGVVRDLAWRSSTQLGEALVVERTAKIHALYGALCLCALIVSSLY